MSSKSMSTVGLTLQRTCSICGAKHQQGNSDRCSACIEWIGDAIRLYGAHGRGVYFVQSGAFIKIGVASSVIRRVQEAWNWNPHAIVPLGWIPEPDPKEAYALEYRLHVQFAEYRHRGEWFHAHESLLEFINATIEVWPQREDVHS